MDSIPGKNEEPIDDFEAFLKESQDKEIFSRISAEIRSDITESINAALVVYDVPSLIDANGTPRGDMMQAAYETALDAIEENGAYTDPETADILAKTVIGQRTVQEQGMYSQIQLMQTAALLRPHTLEQERHFTEHKSRIIGSWLIDQQLSTDSEWVSFLNDTLPGNNLTESEITKATIDAIDAKQKMDDLLNDKVSYARILARSTSQLESIFQDNPSLEISLHSLAVRALLFSSEAEYEAAVADEARKIGVDAALVRTYIEVYRQNAL